MGTTRELDTVDQTDREKIHQVVAVLKGQYEERLQTILKDFHAAQHEVNRAQHEIARLEKHLGRINDFCEKNNVRLEAA